MQMDSPNFQTLKNEKKRKKNEEILTRREEEKRVSMTRHEKERLDLDDSEFATKRRGCTSMTRRVPPSKNLATPHTKCLLLPDRFLVCEGISFSELNT